MDIFVPSMNVSSGILLFYHHGLPMLCMCLFGTRQDGETVAVNRGMNVKTFEIPEDAIEWLTDPTDSQSLLTTQLMRLLG